MIEAAVDDPDGLRADAEIDGSAGTMAISPSGGMQALGVVVLVDGEAIAEGDILAINVAPSLDNWIQPFTIEVMLRDPDGPFGNPLDHGGPGTCLRDVSIFGLYRTSTGDHMVPLLVNGMGASSRRRCSGGYAETISGFDAGSRFDKKLISLILPPGHGLSRRRVIEIMARRAGATLIDLETPWTEEERSMLQQVQLAESGFLSLAQELADVELRRLLWNRDGALSWRRVGPPIDGEHVESWTIGHPQWKALTVELEQPGGDVVTVITVEGEEQLAAGECGLVTTTTKITSKTMNGPTAPLYRQVAAGYSANPQPEAPDNPIVTRVEIIEKVERCKILVYQRRRAWEYYNPESVRYKFVAPDFVRINDPSGLAVYTDENGNGEEPAYQRSVQSWRLVEVDETWHYWNKPGFALAWMPSQSPGTALGNPYTDLQFPAGLENLDGEQGFSESELSTGIKLGTIDQSWRWYAVKGSMKTRELDGPVFPPWEETPYTNNAHYYGSKDRIAPLTTQSLPIPSYYSGGSYGEGEEFLCTDARVTTFESDGNGFLTKEKVYTFGWLARRGSTELYSNGFQSRDAQEEFRCTGLLETAYSAAGDSSHDELKTESNYEGRTVSSVQTTGADGYLPPIESIPDLGKVDTEEDADVYGDEAQIDALYQRALLTETRPFSVELADESLEDCHIRNEQKLNAGWAENEEEAERMGWFVIDDSAAATISGELKFVNFFMQPGDLATFAQRAIGVVNRRGRIFSIDFNWTPAESWTQRLTGRIYRER